VTSFTWNEAFMDTCDTLNIYAGYFYISCGYWEVDAADGTLPFVAKLQVSNMAYVFTYFMGFDLF